MKAQDVISSRLQAKNIVSDRVNGQTDTDLPCAFELTCKLRRKKQLLEQNTKIEFGAI